MCLALGGLGLCRTLEKKAFNTYATGDGYGYAVDEVIKLGGFENNEASRFPITMYVFLMVLLHWSR